MCGHFMGGKNQAINMGNSTSAFSVGRSIMSGAYCPFCLHTSWNTSVSFSQISLSALADLNKLFFLTQNKQMNENKNTK